jgi:hypothetical protein
VEYYGPATNGGRNTGNLFDGMSAISWLHGLTDLGCINVSISKIMTVIQNVELPAVLRMVNGELERGWKEDFLTHF